MLFLKNIKEKRCEEIKNRCIVIMLLYPLINLILNRLIQVNNIGSYIAYFIYFSCVMIVLSFLLIDEPKKVITLISCFLIGIIINYCLHFSTWETTINIVAKNLVSCYILFVFVVLCKDLKLLFTYINKGGYIAVILTMIYAILMTKYKMTLYENGLAIQLVLVMFVSINLVYAFKERKKTDIIFSVLGLIEISCFSSRTIILTIWLWTITLFIIHYIKWFKNTRNKKKKIITVVCIFFLLIILAVSISNYKQITKTAYEFLNQHGIYNRFLRILAEDEMANTSGRTEIVYPEMFKKILESPILGHGIGMDRINVENGTILYAHNIILELYVSFGLFIGSLIIIIISTIILMSLKTQYKYYITAFVFSGLIILMLTSSYLIYRGFWVLLGIIINIYYNEKTIKGERKDDN